MLASGWSVRGYEWWNSAGPKDYSSPSDSESSLERLHAIFRSLASNPLPAGNPG